MAEPYAHPRLNVLAALTANWDTYGAPPVSREALAVANALAFVPAANGALQIELHADNLDIEIGVDANGQIDVWVSRNHRRAEVVPEGDADV